MEELKAGASTLKREIPNPISLTAGTDLFIRYVTTAAQDHAVGSIASFLNLKLIRVFLLFSVLRRPQGESRQGRLVVCDQPSL